MAVLGAVYIWKQHGPAVLSNIYGGQRWGGRRRRGGRRGGGGEGGLQTKMAVNIKLTVFFSLFFILFYFFYVIHQSGVGRASGREGGGKWNVSIFIFYSSFSLVDNIKSHRQAKKGLRKEKTGCLYRTEGVDG